QATTRGVTAAIVSACAQLVEHEARKSAAIKAVSMIAPGHLDPRSRRLTLDWPGWTRVALVTQVERALGEAGIPVLCADSGEHTTANLPVLLHTTPVAFAAAECWTGAARGKSHAIYVELGSNITTGIIVDGRAFYGADGWAGATGWLAVGSEFRHEYETQGCVNAECGQAALVRRTLEEYGGESNTMLGSLIMNSPEQLTAETILRAARGGEALALKVVSEQCRWLGRGFANLISLFNPEAVILGGELGLALNPWLQEVRDEATRWASPDNASTCRIALAKLDGATAALSGAARLVWQQAGN
ncbi:MAG: ROK family protein, partial [Acidobacteria bacterium]|nr:ROK family protein [Acidobacteriota bacterium]